jgi:hypothetical protein
MKHIINIVALYVISFIACIALAGMLTGSRIIMAACTAVWGVVAALFAIAALEYSIAYLFSKERKHEKENSDKRIKMSAILVRHNKDGSEYSSYKVFSGDTVIECMVCINKYAREHGYEVETLKQLTTK